MNAELPSLDRFPRRRLACILAGSLLAFATGGCESLVNSALNPHGHTEVSFPPGVSHEALRLPSAGGRILAASLVRASAPRGPLLLIFHGDGEAIGDWSRAQTFLSAEGFSSLVFDYSGYGDSTGQPTVDHLREDALAAYAAAKGLAGKRPGGGGVFIVAHSLGCNVALDAADGFTPRPVGYALWGVTPSVREYAVRSGALPRPLGFLIPDRWNNLRAVAHVQAPILVLHGANDLVTTLADARAIAARASFGAKVVEVEGANHNALHQTPGRRAWGPILDFTLATR
jgi:alpha-beta hydrolase superfamily lysophospholipase